MNRDLVIKIALLGLLLVALLVTGCQKSAQSAPREMAPPTVTVTRPVEFPVQTYYEYNGNLDAVEMVQINARIMGFLEEVAFKEGDEVDRGDLLFRIDRREYAAAVKKAEADKRKAASELRLAKLEETRGKMLREKSAVSDEDVENRVAARETAEAMVMQSDAAVEAAQLKIGYTEIRAPIAGQISRTMVTPGNLVGQNENTALTNIVSMDPLYVYFDVPERDLIEYQRSLGPGEEADLLRGSIPVEIGVATEDGYPHKGSIDFRENHVDAATGTVRIRGRIPNPRVAPSNARLLYPGLYARVRVPNGPPRKLLAIPEDALMTGQEGRYVYVLGKDNLILKRTVTIGPNIWKTKPAADGEPTQWTLTAAGEPREADEKDEKSQENAVHSVIGIESGLTLEDQIVINGLTKARPGSPVVPDPWELNAPPTTPPTANN